VAVVVEEVVEVEVLLTRIFGVAALLVVAVLEK
jgi:hypothetical protein